MFNVKIFILSFIMLNIFGFLYKERSDIPARDKAMHIAIERTQNQLSSYALTVIGVGGSSDESCKTTHASISFQINQTLSFSECRFLLITSIQTFLANVNSDEF